MVMQWTVNPPSSGTTGSIPVQPTIFSVFSKMDDYGGLRTRKWEFDSLRTGQFRGIGANREHMCFASMSKQFESAILHHK